MASRPKPKAAAVIRRAERADIPILTRTLVRAYMDDPVAVWICRSGPLRVKLLEGLYSARLRQALACRGVWANPERSSVAVWTPPGRDQTGIRPTAMLIDCFLRPRLMARAPLLAVGLRRMARRHPREPTHWYLSLLGTDPDARGHGFGSAVLQPVLERCDAAGVGAYLESSKRRNLDFYARHDFHVLGELQLPRGPTLWPMWREPRDGGA
jgi:GNAT superfamily N-acetyltransferase